MFHRPYYVADIGANHDGKIGRAFKLIAQAAEAGAHAAKFQNYTAASLISRKGFDGAKTAHQAAWSKSVYDTYKDAETPLEWTPQLKEACDACGIDYFTSPYSLEIVDAVDPYVDMYKIGSGDITYHELIKYAAQKGKPVLIGTGAAESEEVFEAYRRVFLDAHCVIMQCNTNYTGSNDNISHVNLNVLIAYHTIFDGFSGVSFGLSDHTPGHSTVLGAIALGATVIEKHFTDDRNRPGNDHSFAMEPHEWREMVDRGNEVFAALGDGVKRIQDNEQESAYVQRRGLRYNRNLSAGQEIRREYLVALRPEEGIAPYRISEVIGRKLTKDVEADDAVKWGDME